MKKQTKLSIGLFAATAMTAMGVISATAGSLAWYAYSRTVKVNFIGTSIAKSALLNVGLVDDAPYKISEAKRVLYDLTREEYDGHSIVFARSTDGIDYHVIQEYLFNSPYAVNLLFPLTTQNRALNDQSELHLYESPLHGDTSISTTALLSHYVQLPLAFRMKDTAGVHIANKDVWLTDAGVKLSGVEIEKGLRIFVENSQRKFLMNPSDRGVDIGTTAVGGLLDLDGDGTYDYEVGGDKHYELYYGKFTGTKVYAEDPYGIPKETAEYDNVNHVTNETESTFYSKHNEIARCIDLTQIEPQVAQYYPLGKVIPTIDDDGNYYEGTTGIKMTTTDSADKVGYVTLTIFLEGWDHVVIDNAAGYNFNLSLRFETNR